MSIDLARAYAEAMERHDLDAVATLLAADVVVVTPKGTVLEGVEAVRAYYSGPGFDHLVVSTEEHDFAASTGGARHIARQVYRWKESGEVAYARPLETLFEVQDDRIARIEMRILSEAAA